MTTASPTTTHLATLAELDDLVGTVLGVSSWLEVTQERINTFADATGDHQWIHVDPERAVAESPFGGPIAHGYLTLSLIIPMWGEVLAVDSVTMAVNYGLNKVRFTNPVPAGGRVRLKATLAKVEHLPKGGVQVTVEGVIELENSERPAVVAEVVYRYFE
ncbi:putative enoyl-CoA hydratase [Gordonia polyisoprenivorans NBRC 16320 = JCM 10675]|uniref:p-hydroxycinnamoyl-CoA hydratase n=1 Tax=Gordonia polyisoprenivorans TaxID=84595 RepID=A0A846WMX9_9ACTN|nr:MULTISPECIES: p-hydroxycinnamoyl-CoA hydratase [Gordonia]MDF3281300.1 p-hydroxycinnamoyl-CoA hydratase [Gordonia sp. N1V]NKY03004.1 p-hydroxycinnamoyl-CoA hydratase [Gordonia polyisoprenivorans]OPX10346.1 dehydratase [Gordonia sp. i37]OZC32850.1 dehydratase [Gordonia polyisoprenivorans]QTI69366.1 p-hydroxycinnamoyl-CoA hydratase [Gordonia polyisoprenivorans]